MASQFSRWLPREMPFMDGTIKLRLRAFDQAEAPAFKAAVDEHWIGLVKVENETPEEHQARIDAKLERWKRLAEETFEKWVRLAEPIEEVDWENLDEHGKPRVLRRFTTGAELYTIAPGDFVTRVLLELVGLASLGDTRGNSSGSPSTSTSAAGPKSTDEPAPTTGPSEGSTSLSTVPASSAAAGSSTAAE